MALWYRLSALPGIVLCGLYLYLGVTLESMLRQNPTFVLTVFRIAMVIQAAYVVLEVALSLAYGVMPVPLAIVGFLIAWYLHVQASRLIQEAAVAEQPLRSE